MTCGLEALTAVQQAKKDQALKDLERQIERGVVTVVVNGTKVEFVGWETDRENPGHWHDDCAYRTLMSQGSTALRQALARAQAQPSSSRMVREVPR